MEELYSFAELFAQRLVKTVPTCIERELALHKVKGVLSLCESGLAMNPKTTGDVPLSKVMNAEKMAETGPSLPPRPPMVGR